MMMEQTSPEKENHEPSESQVSTPVGVPNAPKFGIIIPNRVFVGGISSQTTESDLAQLFSSYGNVLNTKIIADRAGVSKGYGFVTFETEEEAKRLQNDTESIVLRERRLNIAPAIRKQSYQRPFDGMPPPVPGSPVPLAAGQLYRQPGVPFFQNGMAFYTAAPSPQPQPMTPVQTSVEAPQAYPPGAFGGVAQNSSAPNYTTFSYPNQFYYQAPYPYHLACNGLGYVGPPEGMTGRVQPAYLEGYPVGDGTHVAPNNVLNPAGGAEGGVVFAASPYIFAQQYGLGCVPGNTQPNQYFEPQNMPPMSPAATQEPMPPVFYTSPRGYETPTFVYTECPPSNQQPNHEPRGEAGDGETREREREAPSPLHNQENGAQRYRSFPRARGGRPGGRPFFGRGGYKPSPPPARRLNNNDPHCGDRNLSGGYPLRTPNRPSQFRPQLPYSPKPLFPDSSQNHRSPAQVPALQYLSGVRPHYGIVPIAPHFSSPRRGIGRNPKYNGRGGKTLKPQPWAYREGGDNVPEDANVLANALTPPITPRSPHDANEDLSASLSGLTI